MAEDADPFAGLVSQLRTFVRTAVDQTQAASAVALEAIRRKDPELARSIFKEAVLEPAREVLRSYKGTDVEPLLQELESRIRQDDIPTLYHEVETIIASRWLWHFYEAVQTDLEKWVGHPARDKAGQVTGSGVWLLGHLSHDLAWVIAKLASVRERRIQLCLTAHIVGKEALAEAFKKVGSYKREILLHTIYNWLGPNVNDQELRQKIVKYAAEYGSDEHIEKFASELMGTSYMGEREIQIMFWEIFNREEHIEF